MTDEFVIRVDENESDTEYENKSDTGESDLDDSDFSLDENVPSTR